MMDKASTANSIKSNKTYLKKWEFTSQEWNDFTKEAAILKYDDNLYFGLALAVIGIPYLMFYRENNLLIATAYVLPFAILLPFISYQIAKKNFNKSKQPVAVFFYEDYITINGKKTILVAHHKWVKSMHIIESDKGLPPILEIAIAWHTRNGDTFDETRLPIPGGKIEMAKELIEYYQSVKIIDA